MNLSQLLMIGLPADNDLSGVREIQPGGVIFFGRNARPASELRRLARALREESEIAPLVAVDHEGGRVQRFHDGFTILPSARELGKSGAQNVEIGAMNVAAELRAAGLNLNFAPVCDVPTHEGDTVIGDRAFSDDFLKAGMLAAQYVRGAQPSIVCCAKHFPGHGGVGVDSHFGLPVFEGSRDDLEPHLNPFRATIGAGVGAIMIGHICVPALDESNAPAVLSERIVTGVLREEMGFRGLVVTDDLEMGALQDLEPGEIAVRALNAGCDLLLFCHTLERAKSALAAIEKALDDGTLSQTRVEDALNRVAWAKSRFGVVAA